MPRVLIAGCGYVGQATADLFFERGWGVEGWTCSPESVQKLCGKPYPVRAVDISDKVQVADSKSKFDAVVHCASTRGGDVDLYRLVYLNGARNLLDRFVESTIKRWGVGYGRNRDRTGARDRTGPARSRDVSALSRRNRRAARGNLRAGTFGIALEIFSLRGDRRSGK